MNPIHRILKLRALAGLSLTGLILLACSALALADPIPATLRDFHLSGTQVGDAHAGSFLPPQACASCHSNTGTSGEPYASWKGSLMAKGGRDPLLFAQLATANQDVANVGYFCLRCHVPMAVVSGNVVVADGSTLSERDRDGVDCHFCHAMVDPRYVAGSSPPRDATVLAALEAVPAYIGNATFVLDPDGVRRGPRADALPSHELLVSPYHRSSALCGTCHDVGNVAVSRQVDGSYRYNALDTPPESEDLASHFPLERTYTEWKLSAFAAGGVDMAGRFGGEGGGLVSSCQDCHMPVRAGLACNFVPPRADLRSHDFAGASSWVLDIIGRYYADDPAVDQDALAVGMAAANDMLSRAASLDLAQDAGGVLRARVTNESGHKLPTGHIEGRRAWVQVRLRDIGGNLLREYGGYDPVSAELDEAGTIVYEMAVGLSDAAAAATGGVPGRTTRMALADTIVKDTRIPPRGFDNANFAAAGAPTVGRHYADGQYWDDAHFWIPPAATSAEVTVLYQTVTRHYIEALRDANHTDHWGQTLHDLWEESGRAAPITMAAATIPLNGFLRGDFNGNGVLDAQDGARLTQCLAAGADPESCRAGDFNGDGIINCDDAAAMIAAWSGPDPVPVFDACQGNVVHSIPLLDSQWLILLAALLLLLAGSKLRLRGQRRG
ncbi:MAG: dockerin type I domain-containing protein [Dokdonella sp.]